GPFIRLEPGRYSVQFEGDFSRCSNDDGVVLGLEVIAQNRMLRNWRDYTGQELAAGSGSIVFDVPEHLSAAGGVDAPFEFRFKSYSHRRFDIRDVTVARIGAEVVTELPPMRWRL